MRFLSFADTVNHNDSVGWEAKSLEERKSLSQKWILELMAAVQAWSHSLDDGAFKTHGQRTADKQSQQTLLQ